MNAIVANLIESVQHTTGEERDILAAQLWATLADLDEEILDAMNATESLPLKDMAGQFALVATLQGEAKTIATALTA